MKTKHDTHCERTQQSESSKNIHLNIRVEKILSWLKKMKTDQVSQLFLAAIVADAVF